MSVAGRVGLTVINSQTSFSAPHERRGVSLSEVVGVGWRRIFRLTRSRSPSGVRNRPKNDDATSVGADSHESAS